jgi:hypothetical protein
VECLVQAEHLVWLQVQVLDCVVLVDQEFALD